MLDLTDRHARRLLRCLSRRARLYTEMITTGALLFGDTKRFLAFDPAEHPLALQVGGSEPGDLARCARLASDAGYDEINLNVGCPSDRVQNGRFGACLMAEPARVADGVAAMRAASSISVTVKTRIGIDRDESTDRLFTLVEAITAAGCDTVIVHARNAWLDGLSPKENREIPPLRYDVVHDLKRARPDLRIVINGGITTLDACAAQLQHVDGVMLGREAYYNPWILVDVDERLYGDAPCSGTRGDAVRAYLPYVRREIAAGTPLQAMTRHLLGLALGLPGARAWRRTLSEDARVPGAGVSLLEAALERLESAALPPRDWAESSSPKASGF